MSKSYAQPKDIAEYGGEFVKNTRSPLFLETGKTRVQHRPRQSQKEKDPTQEFIVSDVPSFVVKKKMIC